MNKKIFIFLSLIVIVASLLRFWELGKVPASPDWDEVALGYNAYSIMQTGRDEYGEFLPIVLRSFDDYKPALYTYLSIPTISILGMNVVAVRLPSAIFGVLMVLGVFFLVKELFKKDMIALLTAGLLAISPWHIQFSRVAFESNVGTALNLFGILFFLKSFRNPWILLLSSLSFGLSLHVYQSEKVFVPLLMIVLVALFRKHFFSIKKKYILLSFLTFLIFLLPLAYYTLSNNDALTRARGVSIFSDPSVIESSAQKLLRDRQNNDFVGLMLDNRRIEYAKSIIAGYLSHFDLNWLFIKGDISRHHAPNMGLMYLFELPFLLIGIYALLLGRLSKSVGSAQRIFVFAWLLVVPIPASITSGVPHAVRTLNFLPILQIISACGILVFIKYILDFKRKYVSISVFTVLFLFIAFNFSYYLNQYFVQQNYFAAYDWQYGYEKIIPSVTKIEEKFSRIIVSNQPPMDQSYMFFLFYLKYPPELYQEETSGSSGGFRENHEFGKYEFRPIEWDKESKKSGTLFLGRPTDFSKEANILHIVYYPDGRKAILLVGDNER